MRKTLPALILLFALLLGACGAQGGDSYALTLWYVGDDPLAPAVLQLAEEYNAARGRGSLAVTARAWPDEESMLRALRTGALPALVLCSHETAFSLQEEGKLWDTGLSLFSYPAWLCARSESVGRGFFPIGSALELLLTRDAATGDLRALPARAAAYGEETGRPYLTVDRFAPLFYQALLDGGTEFYASAQRDMLSEDYVNFYNALAEAAFVHGLTADRAADTVCRIESSTALRTRDLSGCGVCPLSEGPLLAACRGLAVTARDARMRRALPDFLRRLAGSGRLGEAALEAGLIPAAEEEVSPDTPLEAALVSLMGRTLHLPAAESGYYVNSSAFEKQIRAALELLH